MTQTQRNIGLVGLGLMGTAMSTRLLAAGYGVVGHDVDAQRRAEHADRGGTVVASAADVAATCPIVILSLPNAALSRDVCFSDGGIVSAAAPATAVVDTTTTRPDEAVALGEDLERHGIAFFDVGISGNSARVADGHALGVVGGPASEVPGLMEMLGAFCGEVLIAGQVGDGMRAKLTINHVLTVNRFALAEGLVHAEKMGMDRQRALDILKASAAYSVAMDMWGQRMVDEHYEQPASRIRGGNKDLQLILQLAKESGSPTLALGQVDHVARAMIANGLGDKDNAVLAQMLRHLGGVAPLPAS